MKNRFSASGLGAAALFALFTLIACGEERATGLDPAGALLGSRGLVQCPVSTTRSTQALVPLTGGTVSLGGSSITIPEGALTVPRLITLIIPASPYMEIELHADTLTSLIFQKPVSITIDYSRCERSNIEQAPLTVWYIDKATKQHLETMGGVDDKQARSITFQSGHLSNYAIAF